MANFEALGEVLSRRDTPVSVFFRDDDAGWADQRLSSLCMFFMQQELPLDIAAIPGALTPQSARKLNTLLAEGEPWLHVHQHGFSHQNHQGEGRSCEFGPGRNLQQQHEDIALGREMLENWFEERFELLFTPPWNRCTADTTTALESLGFKAYSRITGSEPIQTALPSVDVSIDWLKKRKGVRLDANAIGQLACRVFESGSEVVGVMLHHEHMDEANRELLAQFTRQLRNSPKVSFQSMQETGATAV